jgi:hypothetical protein
MALVAWILAVFGAGLAFAMGAGSATGLVRRMDRPSAMAVMPLPTLAVYFSASEFYAAIQADTPVRGLIFPGGPFVIGVVTLLGIFLAFFRQDRPGPALADPS